MCYIGCHWAHIMRFSYSSAPKKFNILHPTKQAYRLINLCLEEPLAYFYYQHQYACVVGLSTFVLPDYVTAMTAHELVHVSPFTRFGGGWGESMIILQHEHIHMICNADDYSNVQVVGTRDNPNMEEKYVSEP